jgi:ubiquinone/menaquinone biosynthesis C-methylase UbiE
MILKSGGYISVTIKTEIISNRRLLDGVAYLFCKEMGISRVNIQIPSAEEMNDLLVNGIVSREHKLMDKPFGYACYEYYRQVYHPDTFDTLLIKEGKNRKKMLDLCCGGGATIFSLLQNKPEMIYGLDSDENQIALLDAMLHRSDVSDKVITRISDAHHIPLADHSVDFVVCRVALQYLNVEQVLKEIYRVLSPQGKVFLLVHGSGYLLDYLFSRRAIFKKQNLKFAINKLFQSSSTAKEFNSSQANFLTAKDLDAKLAAAGFQDMKIHTYKEWMKIGVFPVYFAVTAES